MFNLNRKCREDGLDLSKTIRILKRHGVVPVKISSEYYINTPLYLDYAFEQEGVLQRQRAASRSQKAVQRSQELRAIRDLRDAVFPKTQQTQSSSPGATQGAVNRATDPVPTAPQLPPQQSNILAATERAIRASAVGNSGNLTEEQIRNNINSEIAEFELPQEYRENLVNNVLAQFAAFREPPAPPNE